VLIHSAGGGVGIAATQLARLRGATVIGTASSAKHEAIRRLGVHHAIDYRTGNGVADVRQLTGKRGVDVILDPVGGRSFSDSYHLLAPLGRLIAYGVSSLATGERRNLLRTIVTFIGMPRFGPLSLMNKNRGVFGLNLGHLWREHAQLGDAMREILSEVAAGRLTPVVARTFPLAQAADAHRFMQARSNIGKVILTT
jgi:synaptic vesicle membrane protein VAT-1